MNCAIEDIKLQYLYPRIDAEVSKHQNHLLKSPFVVHPGTGRVCVPVDPERVEDFNPESVPTVGMLLRELDKVKSEDGTKETNFENTSLKPYIDTFEKHINAIVKDNAKAKKGQSPALAIGFSRSVLTCLFHSCEEGDIRLLDSP